MKDIKNILNSCVSILKTIRIDYNSPIGPRTRSLISEIKKLIPLLEKEQPHIANILRVSLGNLISNGYFINAYVFGDIRTAINILNDIYNSKINNNTYFKIKDARDDVLKKYAKNFNTTLKAVGRNQQLLKTSNSQKFLKS